MYRIGIDVGSTYTKYCVIHNGEIESLFSEKTPIRQREYFESKIRELYLKYPDSVITSCGYGKKNVSDISNINELTALAQGSFYTTKKDGIILDVGGQDTKIVLQEQGKLKEFFINDKCAAGSGMFLANTLDMIGVKFEEVNLSMVDERSVNLLSTCAVFAQSEIVELIADNKTENDIIQAVIGQIFVKTKPLIAKVKVGDILLSGGLSQIPGIDEFASKFLGRKCESIVNGTYMAAIGCVAELL